MMEISIPEFLEQHPISVSSHTPIPEFLERAQHFHVIATPNLEFLGIPQMFSMTATTDSRISGIGFVTLYLCVLKTLINARCTLLNLYVELKRAIKIQRYWSTSCN
jgi:hypothetical protein